MYSHLSYRIPLTEDQQDIYIAELLELGVESFIQEADVLEAFIPAQNFELESSLQQYLEDQGLAYVKVAHQSQDWNAVWESNFSPYEWPPFLRVRAPFHKPDPAFKMELVISPKMAFGTGHHETTSILLEWLSEQNLDGKSILDFGCGTGILGIYCLKSGASTCMFIDNDPLSVDNTIENLNLNHIADQQVLCGDHTILSTRRFDLILANITRNVLIDSMERLSSVLSVGSAMALSGFLVSDFEQMKETIESNGLMIQMKKQKKDWLCLIVEKK